VRARAPPARGGRRGQGSSEVAAERGEISVSNTEFQAQVRGWAGDGRIKAHLFESDGWLVCESLWLEKLVAGKNEWKRMGLGPRDATALGGGW